MIRRLTKILMLCVLAGTLPWCGVPSARGDGPPDRAAQLKAAFIYNFAQFVEWPGGAFGGPNAPFVMGVVADGGFAGTLEQVVKGKTAGKREIVVKYFANAGEVQRCQILFIGGAERASMPDLFRRAANDNMLTIGDLDGFTSAGGMVRFLTEDNRLRFEVNQEAASAAQLKFGAQLLKLARK
jgi:hypothetical protein